MVLGLWPPLLSLTPLGEPGNGTALAGSCSVAGPCLLQLPATLLPQLLQLLSESQRNLAVPGGPAAVLKATVPLLQLTCKPPALSEHRGQWQGSTARYFLITPRTFEFALCCYMLVDVGQQRGGTTGLHGKGSLLAARKRTVINA